MTNRVIRCLAALLSVALLVTLSSEVVAETQLTAGGPTVLVHPQINKSVGNPVLGLTFITDGLLATAATSGVLLWDVESGKLQQTLDADERAVDSLLLDPQRRLLVSGGASGTIKVWDARDFKLLRTLPTTPGAVRGMSISADSKLLATASPIGQLGQGDEEFGILLWDLATGQLLRKIAHQPPEFGTTLLAFLPDGQLVSAQDREFRVIDVEQGKIVQTIEQPGLPRSLGSLALSSDPAIGELHLATGVFEPRIRIWDPRNWTEVRSWSAHDQQPPPYLGVATVNFSPDGHYVLSGGMDCMACMWDAATGRKLLELDARGEVSARWITGIEISPDGKYLAASNYGGSATIWPLRK